MCKSTCGLYRRRNTDFKVGSIAAQENKILLEAGPVYEAPGLLGCNLLGHCLPAHTCA